VEGRSADRFNSVGASVSANSDFDIKLTGMLVIPDIDAVILAFPDVTAVAEPFEDMVVILVLELIQVA
jgi:hypothetical protein